MAQQAERQLAAEVGAINALNVFPVPDGDTGANMLATIREALAAAEDGNELDGLARGGLLGARGNSGVILSQLFRAQQEVLAGRSEGVDAAGLAAVLARAADLAEAAIANPVPGTMLSVLRAAGTGGSLAGIVDTAEAALAATPDQLAILREAGVVDSGGYGLLCLLRGWYEALAGEPAPPVSRELLGLGRARQQAAAGTAHPAALLAAREAGYGWCVTVLVDAPGAAEAAVRQKVEALGDSALVVAAGGQLKLHVHVPDPEVALAYARGLGTIVRSDVSNIDEQTAAGGLPLVAVVSGEGLAQVFRGLGVAVVAGGQTQNPSTAELLEVCEGLPKPAYLLPNNGNVLAAARQAATSCPGLEVVPTRSVPQGVAAALAFDGAATVEDNLARMSGAAEAVLSAELTPAARAAALGGVHLEKGEMMVLLDGVLLGGGDAGLEALAERVREAGSELVTIYYGLAASPAKAEELAAHFPDLQAEVVRGDQPLATFLLGFE